MSENQILIRSLYSPRIPVVLDCSNSPSRTKQAEKPACDINNIVARYLERGIITHVAKHEGRYDNFIDAPTYHEAMSAVAEAKEAFDTLPAALRKRFGNDPAAFLDFVKDPENVDEMMALGLAEKDHRDTDTQELPIPKPAPAPSEDD